MKSTLFTHNVDMFFNCAIPNSKIAWIQATEMINLWKQHEV